MKFSDIIGQETIKSHLVRTVKMNRVSHALLFHGPEGSGKLALAIAFAQYINCRNRTDTDSCGECPSCIKYSTLAHPDLHFIYPTATVEKNDKPVSKDFIGSWRSLVLERKGYITLPAWYETIGIERKLGIINARDCNEIITTLSYKSYEAEYKVMIIWMVEKLFYAAAPRILKILEEPPDKTLFFLISESQESIIDTILSRTQLIKVPPIDRESLLKALLAEGFENLPARDAAKMSNGNYVESLRLLTHNEEEDQQFNLFVSWMRHCYRPKYSELIDFVGDISKMSRDAQKGFLRYGLRILRESLLMNLKQDVLNRLGSREEEFTAKFHRFVHAGNIQQLADELNTAIAHIDRNANSNLIFLDTSVRLSKCLSQ